MKALPALFNWLGFIASVLYLWHAIRLPYGSMQSPGAGLFPTIIGSALVAITLYLSVRTVIKPNQGNSVIISRGDISRASIVFGMMLFYILALPILGHLLACGFFFVVCARTTGLTDWNRLIIASILVPAVTAFVFHVLLEVPLPLFPSLGK